MMEKLIYKFENFDGPLDLLLHLINKNKLDIKDIKISVLLEQYTDHINTMDKLGIDIKSEFLDMMSRLIYIKSLSLLPKNKEEKILKEELSSQLIEHQHLKILSDFISKNLNFDSFIRPQEIIQSFECEFNGTIHLGKFLDSYLKSFKNKKEIKPKKVDLFERLTKRRLISVNTVAIGIVNKIKKFTRLKYFSLFRKGMSKSYAVATFLALLELIKSKKIKFDGGYIEKI